ncbi:uncharacterized protein HKW66_Vig0089940 [Vigna angularis]|uniref:Uncharacterized protein n=1 Tax=Phaseolus angularis TaxID=3914 RepID=A0A8T0KKP4_PHAAN|nr:uncharacterized protein HKW66_Vig0089940 [Vigna angularis]
MMRNKKPEEEDDDGAAYVRKKALANTTIIHAMEMNRVMSPDINFKGKHNET